MGVAKYVGSFQLILFLTVEGVVCLRINWFAFNS